MTESEISYFEFLSQFDDPESPDRPDRVIPHANYDVDDDADQGDAYYALTPNQKMFGIYEKYFTPEERKKYAAIPANDPTHEINILRKMLFDTFALVPSGPKDRKSPLPPMFFHDLITTLNRAGFVLTRLVALHMELNHTKNRTADLIWEALGEINPHDTDE